MSLRLQYGWNAIIFLTLFFHLLTADRLADQTVESEFTTDVISEKSVPTVLNFPPANLIPSSSSENGLVLPTPSPMTIEPNPSLICPQVSCTLSTVNSAMNGTIASPTHSNAEDYNLSPNDLPITPRISPGLAISGIVLVISGTAYAIIGIRNKWLHTYLSMTYLASLATTALILYVTKPTISQGIQAVYVIVVIVSGLIWGALSIVFTEIVEGLGCLLGGFCLSMWLLTLRSGGLLNGIGKDTLIAALSLGGFATFYIRYIRFYAHMVFISFAGATSTVLGIDCFSRAGLKEFWLYVWDLNSDIFPAGITSYPITRGIKVEISSILFITLLGVISQKKLWKFLPENNNSTRDNISEEALGIEEVEKDIEKQIEEKIDSERKQWEERYGSKDEDFHKSDEFETSDMEHPEKFFVLGNQEDSKEHLSESEAFPRNSLSNSSVRNDKESQSTRYPTFSPVTSPSPKDSEFNETPDDIKSSASTCGTSGEESYNEQKKYYIDVPTTPCLSRKISINSNDHRKSRNSPEDQQQNIKEIVAVSHNKEDDYHNSTMTSPSQSPISDSVLETQKKIFHSAEPNPEIYTEPSSVEGKKNMDTRAISEEKSQDLRQSLVLASIIEKNTESSEYASENFPESLVNNSPRQPLENKTTLKDINIESAPDNFSKVFMSYRTNEWAKHLSNAETPEVDELKLHDDSNGSDAEMGEKPVPVNVLELQQTVESCLSQVSIHSSKYQDGLNHGSRRNSRLNNRVSFIDPEERGVKNSPVARQNSRSSLILDCHMGTAVNNAKPTLISDRQRGKVALPQVHQSNMRGNCSTLIGQRDSIIRNKTQLRHRSSTIIRELSTSPVPRDLCEIGNANNQAGPILGELTKSHSQRCSPVQQSPTKRRSGNPMIGGIVSSTTSVGQNQLRHLNQSPEPDAREQQLANWRASVQESLLANTATYDSNTYKQNLLHENKEQEKLKRFAAERQTVAMNEKVDLMMRSGEMIDAHREALRRLQQKANQNIS